MKNSIAIMLQYNLISKLIILIIMLSSLTVFSQKKTAEIQYKFLDDQADKRVAIQVFQQGDSVLKPVEELDVSLYVERLFSYLPVGDRFNTTDEKGYVEIHMPSDLPGDSKGILKLIIKIEDAETIRDTLIHTEVKWGIPVIYNVSEEKRSLWAARANAPLSLLLLVNSLLLAVWGIIIYICYEMYLIKKE